MPPSKIRPGQEITANFLNYCLGGVTAEGTLEQGEFGFGRHNTPRFKRASCTFFTKNAELIPPNSIFVLKEVDSPLDPATEEPTVQAVKYDGTIKTSLYTNYGQLLNAGGEQINYLIEYGQLYLLQCDVLDPPAAGDMAGVKLNDWTIKKGGIQFLCVSEPDPDSLAWFLALPTSSSKQAVGGVVNNDIPSETSGEVELWNQDDTPNGTIVDVFNPHKVTFYKENVTPGEEHGADRVILFEVDGWFNPLVFPFMLTECLTIDPVFEPENV